MEMLFWIIAGAIAVVYATGWLLPVARYVPGFNFFRGPGRYGIVTTFAIALFAAMLVAVGWQSRRVVAQAVAAALNIGLNLLVIQRYGIVSVALVYVITEWVLLGGYLLLLWRAQRVGALKPMVAAS